MSKILQMVFSFSIGLSVSVPVRITELFYYPFLKAVDNKRKGASIKGVFTKASNGFYNNIFATFNLIL
jgi:hypothetical protein